jgi:nucleoside-diphosphate-sugar epimerase
MSKKTRLISEQVLNFSQRAANLQHRFVEMLAPEKAPGFPFHQQISVGKVQKTFNNSKARDVLGFDTGIDLDQVTHEFAKQIQNEK